MPQPHPAWHRRPIWSGPSYRAPTPALQREPVSLQPLQAGRELRSLRRPHQERPATLAPLQQPPLYESRQPSPHSYPRDAQSVDELGLGRYPVPCPVATLQQKALDAPLDLEVEGIPFPQFRVYYTRPDLPPLLSFANARCTQNPTRRPADCKQLYAFAPCMTNWY